MDQLTYLHALNTLPGFGPKTLRRLLDVFETPEALWHASPAQLRAAKVQERSCEALAQARLNTTLEKEWEKLLASDIQAVPYDDPAYPTLLKEIPRPPVIIYKRGAWDWNALPLITIVGTRKPSRYGHEITVGLTTELVQAGIGVVSGLALGIDSIAHQAALEADGPTVAVLGDSLDDASIAPSSHLPLAQSIVASGGALLSEYPPVTSASTGTFPARNRLMAGLSIGTIIIEATEKSGTLITARHALDFNREVFAVPGPITSPLSQGPHQLIKQGAKLLTSLQDVLEELRLSADKLARFKNETSETTAPLDLSPDETKIFSLLTHEPLHIDRIVEIATLETHTVSVALSLLEMKGAIKNVGGMHYIKISNI